MRESTASRLRSQSTNSPMRTAFATVPMPIRAPSAQAIARTTTAITMFAVPNESEVRSLIPWLRTSHGLSPSSDWSWSTMPNAKRKSPTTSESPRSHGAATDARGLDHPA